MPKKEQKPQDKKIGKTDRKQLFDNDYRYETGDELGQTLDRDTTDKRDAVKQVRKNKNQQP